MLILPYITKCHQRRYGHTHNPKVEWVNNILLVNPSSICYPKEFSGYAYAILEITKEHVFANIIKL